MQEADVIIMGAPCYWGNIPGHNREMHLDWKPETEGQSASSALWLPPKCKNCTLEEIAVLRVIQQEPSSTQKYIAAEIGKSERTVKSITVRLTLT